LHDFVGHNKIDKGKENSTSTTFGTTGSARVSSTAAIYKILLAVWHCFERFSAILPYMRKQIFP